MVQEVEISSLDLRYENYRVRDLRIEKKLLVEISERGIDEPVLGVACPSGLTLLDGFKRYRCALKLHLHVVPYVSAGEDEVSGIVSVLKSPTQKRLGVIEEARFVRELQNRHGMGLNEIADALSRSRSWVSMRMNLLEGMSKAVRTKIFNGFFPAYSYMYILRRFMRMNELDPGEVEKLVLAVSGRNLSLREIEQLAHGYFRGPDVLRREIAEGNLSLSLEQIRKVPASADGCTEFERILLGDIERLQKYMQRVMGKTQDPNLSSSAFYAQAHLLLTGILSRTNAFTEAMRSFYDRCGNA